MKEAYKHVRAMLHQTRSIERIDKNTVLLALQKLIASIAKVLGEIEAEKSDMETKKKEMGGLELIEEVEVTSATWSSDSQAVSGLETNARRGSHSDPLVANVAARSENDVEIVSRFTTLAIKEWSFARSGSPVPGRSTEWSLPTASPAAPASMFWMVSRTG